VCAGLGACRARADEAVKQVPESVTDIDIPVLAASFGMDFFNQAARDFEKLRPDVRVHLAGDARIDEKVRIRVMAGDLPDATDAVLLYDTLIANGKIRDLAPALAGKNWEGDQTWENTFLPGVLERWRRGPHVYGIPFAYGVWAIFYDQDLFARHHWQPPKTWDELYALCDAMKAEGIAPFAFPGVYLRYGDAFLRAAHYNLVGAAGFRAYNELQPGTRSDPRFARAAEVVQRLSTHYFMSGWQGMTHTAADQAFLQRKAAMVTSAWFVSETRGVIPPDFHVGVFNLPVFADGMTNPNTVQAQAGYYFLFETGHPAREQATLDFFRYLTSRASAQAFARQLEAPVALKAVPPSLYRSSAMQQIAEMMQRAPATFDSAPPASAAFRALFNQQMTDARFRLMTGTSTPQQFADDLERGAAIQRERAEDVNRIDYKHTLAAALLLAVCAFAGGALFWDKTRPGSDEPAISEADRSAVTNTEHTSFAPRRHLGFHFLFVGPSLLLLLALVIGPSLMALSWSFFHWDGFTPRTWAGLFNFKWLLFESDAFWFSLRNNLFVMTVPTLVIVPTALFLAALLHRGVWGQSVFRAVFLFPNLLGGVAATLLWMNAYDPQGGLVNRFLTTLGSLLHSDWLYSFHGYAWLAQNHLYWALVPIYLWMACGFNLVLYLAAMQGINPELYEAAELEGASASRQFFTITLPLIRGVLATSAVFLVITGLNAFELIWLLTSQDPASDSHVLSTLMVSTMFREFQIGQATAIAVVMFILVLLVSLWVLRGFGREEVSE
jgi:raffinose/stachyose/melibiose transport system permease protein